MLQKPEPSANRVDLQSAPSSTGLDLVFCHDLVEVGLADSSGVTMLHETRKSAVQKKDVVRSIDEERDELRSVVKRRRNLTKWSSFRIGNAWHRPCQTWPLVP